MKSLLKELAIAALLSISCAAGTLLWYFHSEDESTSAKTPQVAQAAKVSDEVLRRSPNRLLWENVNTGDDLFDGETIRTSERGEVRIRFSDGRFIQLEPESLVVLQRAERAISLDLLEGSLFVNAKETGESSSESLVVKSADKSLDLSGATVSLSRGANDRLDVEVHEGKARIKDAAGGEGREVQSGQRSSLGAANKAPAISVEILSPPLQAPVFLHSSKGNKVQFQWKGYDPAWKVEVLAGPSRKKMKVVAENDTAHPHAATAALPFGKHSWSLSARRRDTGQVVQQSPVFRLDLRGHPPAALLAPEPDSVVQIEKSPAGVEFKWQRPPGVARLELIVATDPELATPVFAKQLGEDDQLVSPELAEGFYFARLAAYYPEYPEPELGSAVKFTVRTKAVMAKPPARIAWTVPEDKRAQIFGLSPQLELSWKPESRSEEIVNYRLRLRPAEDREGREEKALELKLKQPAATTKLERGGRYLASVEAIDQYEHVIGQSEVLELAANEAPLLPAPVILPAEGVLRSGLDGRAELQWQPLPGAKEYELTISNKAGRELLKAKLTKTSAPLKNLMPGEYAVKLEAFDQWGRRNAPGVPRKLLVPDKSGLKAPQLKRIKVD